MREYSFVSTFPNFMSSNGSKKFFLSIFTSFEKFEDAQLQEEEGVVEGFVVD